MRICLAVFLLLCCAIPVLAQVDTATISGVVTDQTGAFIPDARVVIVQLDTNMHVQLLTKLIWTILGAKQTLYLQRDEWPGELQISGTFRMSGGKIQGTVRPQFVGRGEAQ